MNAREAIELAEAQAAIEPRWCDGCSWVFDRAREMRYVKVRGHTRDLPVVVRWLCAECATTKHGWAEAIARIPGQEELLCWIASLQEQRAREEVV